MISSEFVHCSLKRLIPFAVLASTIFWMPLSNAWAQTPSGVIPESFFGMHLIDNNDWPTVSFGSLGKATGVTWPAIEPSKGVYNWSLLDAWVNAGSSHGVLSGFFYSNDGVPPWAAADTSTCHSGSYAEYCTSTVSDMQDWVNFVTALVTRYKGRIQIYELWNEPQTSFTGTYAELVALTQQEYDTIKSLDSSATILSPSMVAYGFPYLSAYFAAGGTKSIDAIAIHSYPNPTNDTAETITASLTTGIRSVMNEYGLLAKPIWDTEGSWGDANAGATTNSTLRSAYVARSYLLHWSMGITRFYWYAWDSPVWGTLWSSSQGPSQAATAYEQVYDWMNGATMTAPCSLSGATSAYHAVITCNLTRSDGFQARAVWNTDGSSTYTAPTEFTQYRDLAGVTYSVPSNHEVPIGLEPILLEN